MNALKYAGYLYTACIAFFLAAFVSRAIEYNMTKPQPLPPAKAVVSRVSNISRAQTITSITERNIFNVDKFEPPPPPPELISSSAAAQTTPFNAKLTGILLAKAPENSRAIITVSKDVYVLDTYKEQDGYKLKSATIDTAIIIFNDREYILTLDNSGVILATAPPPPPVFVAMPSVPSPDPSSSESTLQFTLHRGEIIEQLKDMNTLVRSLQISPLFNGSEYLGYRVTRMEENSPVKQLGLQVGDIINRVNGEDLQEGPKPLFDMMNRIDEISAVTLDVTRNGEKKTLFVEIQ